MKKILIADHDAIPLESLRSDLSEWGYRVVTAIDGIEAWGVLQQADPPPMAILACCLPGLSGVEICRRLRHSQTARPTYVILLVACPVETSIVAGLTAGANDFLAKPVNRNELRARVQAGCTVMDLTEMCRADQDVARFFDLSEDLFCIASAQGFLLRVNQRYERLLGYPVAELYARPYLDFVHPEDVPSVRTRVETLASGDRVIDFRCRLRDSLGNDHWVEWNARSLPRDGTIYAVGRDLSQRLQFESEMLVRERRERAILDNTSSVVYIKGTDGRYQFINRRYAELFSIGQEAAIGMSDGDVFPEEYVKAFRKNDQRVAESRETITVEEIARHEDGDHTYVSVKFPLFDASGRVSAIAGISTDLTEQLLARKTEEELRLGRTFQKKLYPESAPSMSGIDVAGAAIPATQMCGDYYDFVQLGPEHLAICIGDVSGHGLGPALEMVQVRTACRVLLQQGTDLPATFGELNEILSDSLPEGEFVSLLIAVLDLRAGTIRYLGAGHEAFLIRADGSVQRMESTNCVLGIDPSHSFVETVSVEIRAGDLIFFFTDGLSEAMDRSANLYDKTRAIETVSRHRQESSDAILMNVFASVFEFTEGRNIADDISAVVVKIVA